MTDMPPSLWVFTLVAAATFAWPPLSGDVSFASLAALLLMAALVAGLIARSRFAWRVLVCLNALGLVLVLFDDFVGAGGAAVRLFLLLTPSLRDYVVRDRNKGRKPETERERAESVGPVAQ